jgi:hypothetical protein
MKHIRGDERMKNLKNQKKKHNHPKTKHTEPAMDELFETCIRKGLIEKTEYGYYFKPEFFETLDIYDDDE